MSVAAHARAPRPATLLWPAGALAAAAVVGAATAVSLQAAVTLVVVASVAVIHVRSPRAGLIALWWLWLITPIGRRMFDLFDPAAGDFDVLALCPFLATAVVAALEYDRRALSGRANLVVGAAALGFALGIPEGVHDTLPAVAAFVAYICGLSAFVIGYGERHRNPGGGPSLERALLLAMPLVAVYGIYQALYPLPEWDAKWSQDVDLVSFGTKDPDDPFPFRIYGMLNSPATLAAVCAVFLSTVLVARKLTFDRVFASLLALTCLALTLVRSAWLALAVALVAAVVLSRGRRTGRALAVVALVLAVALVGGSGGGAIGDIVNRATTLTNPSEDLSTRARVQTTAEFLPEAVREPLGHGLGSVGAQLRQLSGVDEEAFPDNGYLATLYQLGPPGTLLVLGALLGAVAWSLLGRMPAAAREARLTFVVIIAMLLTLHISTDIFYGVTAVIAWYCAGALVALREQSGS